MSWFNIFLHPKKYAREIKEIQELLTQHEQYSDNIEKENNELKEQVAIRDNNIVELKNKIATLNQTIDLLSTQLSDNSKELSSTRELLNQANKDLQLVSEIENLFEIVKSRHENYKNRIKHLTDSLNEAQKQLDVINISRNSEYDEITTINISALNDTTQNSSTLKNNTIPSLQPKTPSLFDNEEKPITDVNNNDDINNDYINNDDNNDDSNNDDNSADDWLLPLPEDL